MLHIPSYHKHNYNSIPRNKDLKIQVPYHCNSPSRDLVIDWAGNCFVCSCEAWLPVSIGHISEFTDLSQIWNSREAVDIQSDIDTGNYTHCAVDRCGVLHKDLHKDKYTISINIDDSCNLACPSCRSSARMIQVGEEQYHNRLEQVEHIVNLLQEFDAPCHIVMSGNGDPLASHIMRPLIKNFTPRNNQTIRLFTNGLLMKKLLPYSKILNNITQYFISIDAGSKSVYEQVRQPGRWKNLLENLDWLYAQTQRQSAEVLLNFVLQNDNYDDIDNFIDLCEHYNFNGVVHRLEDWGTWQDFASADVVGNIAHKNHTKSLSFLNKAIQRQSPLVDFGSSLRDISKSWNTKKTT